MKLKERTFGTPCKVDVVVVIFSRSAGVNASLLLYDDFKTKKLSY